MTVVQDQIRQIVTENRNVLFMKGTPDFPQCGFSGKVVQILGATGAEYTVVNVLSNPEIREGIKEFGNWPTIPQLYAQGELVGGADIVTELYESGELQTVLAGPAAV